jgi:hypothetical protein
MRAMIAVLMASLLLLTGCASASKSDPVAEVKFWAYAAASIGTQEVLHDKPDLRPAFERTVKALDVMIASGNGDPAALQQAIAGLPVDNLSSREARIAVQLAKLSFARYGQNVTVDLSQRSPYILATATALRDGMQAGLVPR